MQYHVPEKLHADLSKPVVVHTSDQPWTPSPMPGVERRFLERDGGEVARASSIVRYAPGSAFPRHVHDKGEEYLVLSGVFSDEQGDFGKGAYVRNPPGSSHAPFTKEGCTIFVKLRQFLPDDNTTVRIAPGDVAAERTPIAGLSRTFLYKSACEIVALEDYAPGIKWTDREGLGGEEILVIEGDLLYGDYLCETGTWLRFPAGTELPISGMRIDAAKHYSAGFQKKFIEHLRATVGADYDLVGEYWRGEVGLLLEHLELMDHQISLFDVPLVGRFSVMSRTKNADLRQIFQGTLVKQRPRHAVVSLEVRASEHG